MLGIRRERRAGSRTVRIRSAAEESPCPVLNLLAGLFHVLAEAVGRIAADAHNGQDGGGKEQQNETLR